MGRNVEDFQESQKRISPQAKSEILSTFGDARILVIDEVSMLSPVMLAFIDLRLRQCFDPEKHFGGLHVILMGDMFQFAPIGFNLKKPALYQAAVLCSRNRKLPNLAYRNGANLFMKFRLVRLKGQERADTKFETFLKPLRDTSRKMPITRSWVKKLMTLTTKDIRDDPTWAFATVAVTGNDERLAITKAQVKRFGWMRNEPVLQWVCPERIGKVQQEPRGKKQKIAYTYRDLDIDPSFLKGKYSALLGFFVRGAPCVLSENLCTALGYAKGTQGILESAIWDPKDGEVPDLKSLPRGVVTTVRQPAFLLVRVKGNLIPIGTYNGKIEDKKKQRHLRKSKRTKKRVTIFRKHPVDLLFAVTYHKLQGVTLNKLVLTINKHPNRLLRLVLSSLYVGISRVHKMSEVRVLPYTDEDVDYLVSLKFDDLLSAWIGNYTNEGRWKYDGFKAFEQKMLEKTQIDLGMVDNLRLLTIEECRNYVKKLDIIATGSKVDDLRSALKESYFHGRNLLNAGNGRLLHRQRITLYKQLKKLGDYSKLSVSRLRYYAKRLGIAKCVRMKKHTIISSLRKFESTHKTEIGNVTISQHKVKQIRKDYVGPMAKKVWKKRRINVPRKAENVKHNIRDDQPKRGHTQRYKGLQNLGNTCYFNSVVQCLVHCSLTKQAIENVPQHILSNQVLRELRLLFMQMTNNDPLKYISPSRCYNAVMQTPQCKSVQMGLGNRQQDVHEFFVKLMEHFEEDNRLKADTFNLFSIFKIQLRSTTMYQQCSHLYEKDEYLWQLSLYFPPALNEDAASSSTTFDISYLLEKYFQQENIHEASCPHCGLVGQTVKNLNIINAPQVLVLHLSRFHGGIDKIDTFVKFQTDFVTNYIKDDNGQQVTYRLTGLIVHIGFSIAAGHYTAYFLVDGHWYEANDTKIRQVSWQEVRQLNVYILFYQRL